MIYFSYNDQSLFALYRGVMIRCIEIPGTWLFIQNVMNRAHETSTIERQQAHYFPEHRGMRWTLKMPFSRVCWDHLNVRGVVVNRLEAIA